MWCTTYVIVYLSTRLTLGAYCSMPATKKNTVASRSRALVSPIDASLALWGEERRGRVAELEEELRRHGAEQQQQQQQLEQEQGSSGSAEAARYGNQAERDRTLGSKPSAAPGQETVERKQHTDRSRTTQGNAGPHTPPPPPPASGGIPDRVASNSTNPSLRTIGGNRSRAPLSSTTLLEERLGRWGAGWRPPALRGLPRGGEGFFSGWTHLGQPERFELVKCVNRYRRYGPAHKKHMPRKRGSGCSKTEKRPGLGLLLQHKKEVHISPMPETWRPHSTTSSTA